MTKILVSTNTIAKFPKILCIVVNRANYDKSKNDKLMLIDSTLNLQQYSSADNKAIDNTYGLYSIICHLGSDTSNGHYYAVMPLVDGTFKTINDANIYFQPELSEIDLQNAYLIFYELKNSVDMNIVLTQTNDPNYDLKVSRFDVIKDKVKTGNQNDEISDQIDEFIFDYTDIFYLEGDMLTACDILEHSITLHSDSQPVNVRPYVRRSRAEIEEIEKQVQKLDDLKLVEPCRSPYNSPIHFVRKGTDENGNLLGRIVFDYRKLNEISIGEVFCSVQVQDIIDQLHGSRYFTCVDLSQGYMQIRLRESCQEKTAFSSGNNTYKFLRMPLGLHNASHSFNRCLKIVFADLIGKILYIYLDDDLVIHSKTIPEHLSRLRIVFETLRKHNLKLNPKKCNFLQTSIPFLGFIISDKGVLPDPKKTSAISNLPQPKNPKAVKSFMGMVNYYSKHIHNLAEHAKPLHNLLKKDAKFIWSNECQTAFDHFKVCLTTPPILQYPDFDRMFYIVCDASKNSISSILCQGTRE